MTIRNLLMTILLTCLATLNLAASCTSSDYPDRYPPDRYPSGGGGYPGGYPGGGGYGRVIITEGEGRLAWSADQNGEVYVYDARQNRLLFNGQVRRGDQIEVEPGNDRILINNNIVYRQNMERDNRHQIAFERVRDNYPGPAAGRGRGNYPWYREGIIITEGDDRLAWNADQNGQVYVYDYGEDKLVWNGPIRRGQHIEVIPFRDLITVDGQPVYEQNLRRNARHQIVLVRLPGDVTEGRGRGRGNAPLNDPLPQGARRVASGTGDIYLGEAPDDGMVYVYDEDDRRVIYRTEIGRNNSFQIFPREDYVNLNSRRQADVRFDRGHRHSLYFRAR